MAAKRGCDCTVCDIQRRGRKLSKLERFTDLIIRKPCNPQLRQAIRALRYLQDGVDTQEHRWVLQDPLFLRSRLLRVWHSMAMDLSI